MSGHRIGVMNGDKNGETSFSRKLLKKKFLDRWENEGGKVCTEPESPQRNATPVRRGTDPESFNHDRLTQVTESSSRQKGKARRLDRS